jgi:hypothetical protein
LFSPNVCNVFDKKEVDGLAIVHKEAGAGEVKTVTSPTPSSFF